MALEYFNDTPKQAFRKIEMDLNRINPSVNLRKYKSMTPLSLQEEIAKLDSRKNQIIKESSYGEWIHDESFVESRLLRDALSFLMEYKNERKMQESLVPGFTYYRKAKVNNNLLEGQKIYFREGNEPPMWAHFSMPLAVAKAFEVMRHGNENDFKTLYIEMADGRIDSMDNVSLEHLTESSEDALASIETYCDKRWEGPWPWEMPTPYSLRESIEENLKMATQNAREMQLRFDRLVTRLNEEEMDKYAVIAAAEEMSGQIEKMVQQVARIGGEGIITLKDQIRVAMGDDAAAQIEDTFLEPVRNAADALSKLRATIGTAVDSLKDGDAAPAAPAPGDMPMGDEGDSLGTPGDAISPDGEDLDDMADAAIAGEDGERPMKDM